MPEISIIVPVYNVEKYLRRCVDSILAQTFRDFELILVDDGSYDKSSEICEEYAKTDSRISVVHKKNGGLSSARNSGLDVATGKYIGFVDSDDWIATDCYEHLYMLMIKHNADVVSADYIITDGINANFSGGYKEKVIDGTVGILKFYLKQDNLHGKNDFSVCTKLYKKEMFDTVRFPSGKIYEDNITNFKILKKCARYVKSFKPVYAYFQRQMSITKTKLTEKHLALIDISKEMYALVGDDKKLQLLCKRKIAMAYFSVLSMYVRYGTDFSSERIKKLLDEYKKIKHFHLRTEKSLIIHIISFFLCMNIVACRKVYLKINGGFSCS